MKGTQQSNRLRRPWTERRTRRRRPIRTQGGHAAKIIQSLRMRRRRLWRALPERTAGIRTRGFGVALQPLQVGAHIGRALVAQVAIFFQRLADDARASAGSPDSAERGQGRGVRMASKISAVTVCRETAACRLPFRKEPRRRRTGRCARPVPSPRACSGDM